MSKLNILGIIVGATTIAVGITGLARDIRQIEARAISLPEPERVVEIEEEVEITRPPQPEEDFPGELEFPSPEEAAQAIACRDAGGFWDGIACTLPSEVEVPQEEIIAGALLPLQFVEEPEIEETFLTSGELAIAQRTAELQDITVEEAVETIEEQKIAAGFVPTAPDKVFHVGEVAIINSGSLQGEEFTILSIVDSSVTGTTPKRSGVRTLQIGRLDRR